MIISKLDEQRRKKAAREKRDLSLQQIAEETGITFSTLQRLRRGEAERVTVAILEKLCAYFALTSFCDLIEYWPEQKETPQESEETTPDAAQEAEPSEPPAEASAVSGD
jgi:transcriptional regulator with XRE-family HTH domain